MYVEDGFSNFTPGFDVQKSSTGGLKVPPNGLKDSVERFCDRKCML